MKGMYSECQCWILESRGRHIEHKMLGSNLWGNFTRFSLPCLISTSHLERQTPLKGNLSISLVFRCFFIADYAFRTKVSDLRNFFQILGFFLISVTLLTHELRGLNGPSEEKGLFHFHGDMILFYVKPAQFSCTWWT